MNILLLSLSVLPVILLMVFIYRQDKYQKEPIKTLAKAFIGGMFSIVMDIAVVSFINRVFYSESVFYSAFWEAGIPEELCKFLIFWVLIWGDKHFDEYMDGIVYATFIGLGFACVENIMYVFSAASESLGSGIGTGIVRALLSVPAHFLFGVVMGYFLSLAKFKPEKRGTYLISGLLLAMLAHGLFDWLLMASDIVSPFVGVIFYVTFLVGDIFLWKIGMKYIRRQQENSRLQGQEAALNDVETQIRSELDYDPEYRQIDWNAGNRQ